MADFAAGQNPFGQVAAGQNPFEVEGIPAGKNPFAVEGPSFLEHMGNLLKNSPMIGTVPESAIPADPLTQLAVGANQGLLNAPETFFRERVLDEEHRNTLENQQRLAELKGDRKVAGQLLQEAQAADSPTAKAVGNALQSVPGSAASLVGAAVLPAGPALAMALGTNMALETAGDYTQRRDTFGQTPEEAEMPALLHGAVATGLEALPAGAAIKYMKGTTKSGVKALAKVGVGAGVQEGATSLYDDLVTNYQNLTAYTPEQIAGHAGEAALTGMLMVPMLGPAGKLVQAGHAYGQMKAQDRLVKAAQALDEEAQGAARELQRASEELYRQQVGVPLDMPRVEDGQDTAPPMRTVVGQDGQPTQVPFIPTAEEEALAEIQKAQRMGGLDVPVTDAAVLYGLELTEGLGQTAKQADLLEGLDPVEALQDMGGVSALVQARRNDDPGLTSIPTALRPIVFAADQRVVGLSLGQTGIQPKGTVTIVGEVGEHHPASVMEPFFQLYTDFVKKYMPDARVVVDLARLGQNEFGNHKMVVGSDGEITHVITPMDMLNMGRHGVSDERTAMSLMMAASHEFGHALVSQALPDGLKGKVAPELIAALNKQAMGGVVSAQVMKALKAAAPAEAALVQEWADLRKAVLDGTLTAVEFVERWAGGRKLGDSVKKNARNQSLYSWAERMLGGRIEGKTALELVKAVAVDPGGSIKANKARVEAYLSLQEYSAEQFSKYAYSSGELENSALAKLFPETMAKLRTMFVQLKTWAGLPGQKVIQPGVAFAQWVDSLTERAKLDGWKDTPFELSPALMKKQRAIVKAAGKKALEANKKKNEKKVEALTEELRGILEGKRKVKDQAVPPKGEKGNQVERKRRLTDMLEQYFIADFISVKMEERLSDMLQRGELAEVEEKLMAIGQKNGMYDRDYTSKVLERLSQTQKKTIKAETLRATIRMADVKAQERAMWERFLAAHPAGFTLEEAEEALAANVMPLEQIYTRRHADIGLQVLGAGVRPSATSVIWEGPTHTGGSQHFPSPNYVMHSRRADYRGKRWVLELQSDLFQRFDRLIPETAQELTAEEEEVRGSLEHAQLLIDELEDSIKSNDPTIYLNEGSLLSLGFSETMARSLYESQDQQKILQALQLYELTLHNQLRAVLAEQQRLAKLGPLDQLRELRGNWWERLIREEIAEANVDGMSVIYFPSAPVVAQIEGWDMADPDTRAQVKGIYARYASTIPKFLKKQFGAVEVQHEGNLWYAVTPEQYGETIGLYDRDNPSSSRDPQVVLDELAGLAPEDFRNPERISEAQDFWARLGKESPYFKRWFGQSQVPELVWRGTGNPVAFLDTTTRGGLTGASSAKKAFWFSDNRQNAEYYAAQALHARKTVLKEEYRRDASYLRKSIAQAKELLQVVPVEDLERQAILRRVISRDTDKLAALNLNPDNRVSAAPTVRGHYLRLENPLIVDGLVYGDEEWDLALDLALRGGHDGVIYKNSYDPFKGTVYAVFSPEQVKADSNMGTFDPTDELHWDRDSPVQQAFRTSAKIAQQGWDEVKLRGLNGLAWAQDQLIQLQQLAAAQPNDPTLAGFMRVKREADSLKNKLMGRAEDTAKKLMSVTGSSDELRAKLHGLLKAEWKTGGLKGLLVGKDAWGNVVWGGELGDTGREQRALISAWEVTDSLGLRQFFHSQGVDVESESGKKLLEMYLDVRNTFMQQFYELGLALKSRANKAYANTPLVKNIEYASIDELVFKQVASPFVPVGNFGDWVVIIKRGKETIKISHYESEAAYDKAYGEALRLVKNDPQVDVKGKHLTEEERGMMLPLPKGFLEKLAATGEFTDAQLELLQDVLQVGKYEKINERYEKISQQMDGSNENFERVFADYSWHNANYIWKMKHRAKFQDVLKAGRKIIRELERDDTLEVAEKSARLKQLRRNQELMEHQMNYILKPQDEFQNVRGYIALAYLSFGVKTALMNMSTHLNTIAGITTEYGTGKGVYHYGRAWRNLWTVWSIAEARRNGEVRELTQEQQKAGLDPLVWAMGRALEEGIIDQSFAYFLAGQSNSNAFMRAVQKNKYSALASRTLEYGMLPFQLVEKTNRMVALLSFFSAGLEENAKEGNPRGLLEVYDKASRRVDQTQNAYDPANRAKVLQGQKALFTMFMSYTLFQGHLMTGGLDRAIKADIGKENEMRGEKGLPPKANPAMLRSATMKLWMVYLLLAGGLGLPFAENLLDVVRLFWKKFWPAEDPEVTLRVYLEELGADPNLVLHGVSHDVGGFDVSGSLGLGRLVPGTALLGRNWKTKEEAMGALVAGASGPAGSFFLALVQSSMELGKGNLLEAGKALPGALGSVSKAVDAAVAQANRPTYGVTTKSGKRLTMDLETGEFRDLTTVELVGQAMGFTPEITKVNREVHYRVTSEALYWHIRKDDLMDKYRQAVVTQDEPGRSSVDAEIQRFNSEVPSPKMRITGKTKADSLRTWRKGNQLAERFGTRVKGLRGAAEEIRGAYMGGDD